MRGGGEDGEDVAEEEGEAMEALGEAGVLLSFFSLAGGGKDGGGGEDESAGMTLGSKFNGISSSSLAIRPSVRIFSMTAADTFTITKSSLYSLGVRILSRNECSRTLRVRL